MRGIIPIIFLFFFNSTFAQRNVDLKVGDSLKLGTCSNKEFGFLSMDLVVKSRIPDTTKKYNFGNGDGLYDWFFTEPGDLETKRLPCSYAGRKFRIGALQQYDDTSTGKKGEIRTVILGQIDNERTIIWIEVNKAIAFKEIIL